jgi:DNA-binding PadR family transcriptional regulator
MEFRTLSGHESDVLKICRRNSNGYMPEREDELLYKAARKLDSKGLVNVDKIDGRRRYTFTDRGRQLLERVERAR